MILDNPAILFASLIFVVWMYSFVSEQITGADSEPKMNWWFFGEKKKEGFTHTFLEFAKKFPQQFSALFSSIFGSLIVFTPEFWKRPQFTITAFLIALVTFCMKTLFDVNGFGFFRQEGQKGRWGL